MAVAEAFVEGVDGLGDGVVDLALCEDERVGDFEHREGEGEESAGDEVGGDEGDDDASDGGDGGGAEVDGGLFELAGGLLESGDGGAHDIGQSADRVGDDQQQNGVGVGSDDIDETFEGITDAEGPREGHGDIAEGHDESGDGEGEHGERVDEGAPADARADDDVPDEDADEEVDDDRGGGVLERVDDGSEGDGVSECIGVVLERPGARDDALVPGAFDGEGGDDDASMGDEGEAGDEGEGARRAPTGDGAEFLLFAGAAGLGVHGVGLPTEDELADDVEQDGGEEHDDGECVGLGGAGDLLDAVEDLDGGDGVEVEHQRGAEFGEGPDEDDGAAGEEAGADEGERDPEESSPGSDAEILGGLFEGGVEVGEGGSRVQIEDGIEVEGFGDDDPPELGFAEDVPVGAEEGVEGAGSSEDGLEADGADERGEDEGDEDDRVPESFEGVAVLGAEEGERERDEEAEEGGGAGDEEGVEQAAEEERVFEDEGDMVEGEAGAGGDILGEAAADGQPDGINEEDAEEGEEEREDRVLDGDTGPHEGGECSVWRCGLGRVWGLS